MAAMDATRVWRVTRDRDGLVCAWHQVRPATRPEDGETFLTLAELQAEIDRLPAPESRWEVTP